MFTRRLIAFAVAFISATVSLCAQTINPADYGNITLHLRAETLALGNNAPVTAWGGLTASGTAAPTYIASDARFGNRPVVRFDGVNDVLKAASANLAARTIFAVVTVEGSAPTLATLLSNGNDQLCIRRADATLFYRSPGQMLTASDFVGHGTPTGVLAVNNVPSGSYQTATPHIVAAVAGGAKTFTALWLGNAKTTLGRDWQGSVAEIIVYDGVLTDEGMKRVGWYLQDKYQLSGGGYPSPVPTIAGFTATAGGLTATTGVLSMPGAPVGIEWNVSDATAVSINQGALASTPALSGSVTVSPTVTTTYTLTATNAFGPSTRAVTVHIGATVQPLVINEFLADNADGLRDEDGTKQDWIELHNPNPFAVSAAGWQLTDGGPAWTFPAAVIEGGAYPVVFASGKNRTNPAAPLHTDFSLSNEGEYLALIKPNATIATQFSPTYPAQRSDLSCGPGAVTPVFYPAPTPGAANGATVPGFVADTNFSVTRGFFTTPQTVALSCATPGAVIRYTTDNSTPTETNGTTYTAPLAISTTRVLRVRAFASGLLPSNTDTQTYVFPANVLNQVYGGGAPAGWPFPGATQLNGQTMRYGFNSTLKAQYTTTQLLTALAQIPSVSIVTDQANLTGQTTGIYVNAMQKGDAWERAASVEYLPPDNSAGFHLDCGLRIRGGYSRNDGFAKHSFRLFFRNSYGTGSLQFPLHGAAGTEEFQTLDLRTEQNYSWANDSGTQNTAVREVFCRDLAGAMGQPQTRSRYVHLYLNGQYWGLYMTEERAQEDFAATYFGGAAEDYDVVQTSNHPNFTYEIGSGSVDAWQQTWLLARTCASSPTNANYFALLGRDANGVRVPEMPVYLDPEHLAANMLLFYYTGDGDAPLSGFFNFDRANNWRGFRDRLSETGWRFFPHDGEHTLLASSWVSGRATANTTFGSSRSNFTYSNQEWMHEDLAANAEYKLKIADVAQKHLFRNGALTPTRAQALFNARALQIGGAIMADVVRWGTTATNHNYGKWQARLEDIRTNFFPARHTAVLTQLRTRGFYPSVSPPVFSQAGGQVPSGYTLTLSPGAQTGTIYYTLNGSDPRAVGGAVATATGALTYTAGLVITGPTTVRTRFRSSGGVWSALDEADFTLDTPAAPGNLVVSKVHFHPPDATAAEAAAGFASDDDFEYLELLNTSATTLDLRSVEISGGVTFSFASAALTSLAPGGRVLVVGNAAAFPVRYGSGRPVAGQYDGNLSNGGEYLRVGVVGGAPIVQFTYDDVPAWPVAPDGGGAALVLVNPAANVDPVLGTDWRASYVPGGVPGAADAWTVALWRAQHFTAAELAAPVQEATLWGDAADPDADGHSNYAEFTFTGSPRSALSHPVPAFALYTDPATQERYLRLACFVREGLGGVALTAQGSNDLDAWLAGPTQISSVTQGNGTALVTWQDSIPLSAAPDGRRFLRLQAVAVP